MTDETKKNTEEPQEEQEGVAGQDFPHPQPQSAARAGGGLQGAEEELPTPEEQAEKSEIPPSEIHVVFDAPGSAMITKLEPIGIVAANQMATLGILLVCQAWQAWNAPVIERMIQTVVFQTLEEIRKPQIEVAAGRFFGQDLTKGMKPS